MTDVDELVRCITALLALNERNVLVPHGVPGLARDCLKSASAELERMRDQENAEWVKANDRAVAAEAEVVRLREEIERIADLTERWSDSLVSQANHIARAALAQRSE